MFSAINWVFRNITTIILVVVICALLILGIEQCTKKNKEIDRLQSIGLAVSQKALNYKDSLSATRQELSDKKLEISNAQKKIAQIKADFLANQQANLKAVQGMTMQQQRKSALKGLVANGSLSASRLPDTLKIVQRDTVYADSAIVAATDLTLKWYKTLSAQQDSLLKGYTATSAENETLKNQVIELKTGNNNLKAILNVLSAPCKKFFQQLFCQICRETRRAEKKQKKMEQQTN